MKNVLDNGKIFSHKKLSWPMENFPNQSKTLVRGKRP